MFAEVKTRKEIRCYYKECETRKQEVLTAIKRTRYNNVISVTEYRDTIEIQRPKDDIAISKKTSIITIVA